MWSFIAGSAFAILSPPSCNCSNCGSRSIARATGVTGTIYDGRETLRACILHPGTTEADLTTLVSEVLVAADLARRAAARPGGRSQRAAARGVTFLTVGALQRAILGLAKVRSRNPELREAERSGSLDHSAASTR